MAEKRFTLRIEDELLQKLYFIADYEDRSANGQIVKLIRKQIEDFESEHGCINHIDVKEKSDR